MGTRADIDLLLYISYDCYSQDIDGMFVFVGSTFPAESSTVSLTTGTSNSQSHTPAKILTESPLLSQTISTLESMPTAVSSTEISTATGTTTSDVTSSGRNDDMSNTATVDGKTEISTQISNDIFRNTHTTTENVTATITVQTEHDARTMTDDSSFPTRVDTQTSLYNVTGMISITTMTRGTEMTTEKSIGAMYKASLMSVAYIMAFRYLF